MVIHALVDHSNTQVKARCGETVEIKSGNSKLPDEFSTWASDVTCSACKPAPSQPLVTMSQ